jgi:formamidopyrimidine-DNA glycosylase
MPELPEVEAVTRRVRRLALGVRITAAGVYRPGVTAPQYPDRLKHGVKGRAIEAVQRRGKNILLLLEGGAVVRVHLRMTGNLTVIPDSRLRPVTARVWFELDDGRALILDDPRALGRVTLHNPRELAKLFEDLGPEPLSAEFTVEHFIAKAKRSAKPIKLLLMEQRVVVGLGNIYAAEVLFQTKIHPARPARRIGVDRLVALHGAIVETLKLAINSAVISYDEPGGFSEGENFPVAVYGRESEACMRCGTAVRRMKQGGRSTYFCPGCQR